MMLLFNLFTFLLEQSCCVISKTARDNIIVEEIVDNIEESIDKNNWSIPTYTDLLFSL